MGRSIIKNITVYSEQDDKITEASENVPKFNFSEFVRKMVDEQMPQHIVMLRENASKAKALKAKQEE